MTPSLFTPAELGLFALDVIVFVLIVRAASRSGKKIFDAKEPISYKGYFIGTFIIFFLLVGLNGAAYLRYRLATSGSDSGAAVLLAVAVLFGLFTLYAFYLLFSKRLFPEAIGPLRAIGVILFTLIVAFSFVLIPPVFPIIFLGIGAIPELLTRVSKK